MTRTTTTTTTPFVITPAVKYADQDESIPYRLVGTYEYDRALKLLTSLIAQSTPEQIASYNNVLQDRAEFSFLNGLALAFEKRPELDKVDAADRQKFNDKFKRKGLAWMMALAKVELAATKSLYGDDEFPFETMLVTEFDRQPYLELLTDDVAAHLRSLKEEKQFQVALDKRLLPNSDTLAYLRRLKLVDDMLNTLTRAGGEQVASRITPYSDELAKYRKQIAIKVARAVTGGGLYEGESVTRSRTSTYTQTTAEQMLVGRCKDVLDRFDPSVAPPSATPPTTTGGQSPRENRRIGNPVSAPQL